MPRAHPDPDLDSGPDEGQSRTRRWNNALWVLQYAVGLTLTTAGAAKLVLGTEGAQQFTPWAPEMPTLFVVTAVLDVLGGLGVLLPSLTKVFPWVTVVAASGVVALMGSAVVFFLVRGEPGEVALNMVLGILAALVAVGRARFAPIVSRVASAPPLSGTLPQAAPPEGMRIFQLPTGSYSTPAALAFRGGSFRDRRPFAATAVLIEHPDGDLLLDAGFGADAEAHIASLPSYRQSSHDLASTASEQLDSAGYDRSRLRGVLVTHSHWDHVSGLDSIEVPIMINAEELQHAAEAKGDRVFATISSGHEIVRYEFDGPDYLGFGSSHDVHGDGSVVIVPAAGHTAGSVIVFVTVPGERRYAFIGDLTWQLDGVTSRVERPWLMQKLADTSPRQVRDDLARVLAIADQFQVVPAHDARGFDGIPTLEGQPWRATTETAVV